MRIDAFIERQLRLAAEAEGSGIDDLSNRLVRLGFAGAANVRYSSFLAAFRSSPHLTERYRESYPNSVFLPWDALHVVIRTLDLWIDLPKFYRGAVPPEQVPWMEIFDLNPADRLQPRDIVGLLPGLEFAKARQIEEILSEPMSIRYGSELMTDESRLLAVSQRSHSARAARIIRSYWKEAHENFFVVAPEAAFESASDWLTRLKNLVEDAVTGPTIPPDDPLVIRFCHGGCLVVAAWGEEAAALNELTRSLGI